MLKFVCAAALCLGVASFVPGCQNVQEYLPITQSNTAFELVQASVVVVSPYNTQGSGTLIDYNGKVYLLTVNHLFDNIPDVTIPGLPNMYDMVIAFDYNGTPIPVHHYKHDAELDFAMFEVIGGERYNSINTFAPVFIAADVWTAQVVGFIGLHSDGIITVQYDDNHYCSNIEGELGSSGSGVYYKGTTDYVGMVQAKETVYPFQMVFLPWTEIEKWLDNHP